MNQILQNLFKDWLKSLPIPLLTFELFDDFLKLNTLSESEKIVEIAKLIVKIPLSNRQVLFEFMKLNTELVKNENKTKSSPQSLAIVFSSLILKKEDVKSTSLLQMSSLVSNVFIDLIGLFPKYFEEAEKLLEEDD